MFKISEFYWQGINRFQQKHKGKQLARSRAELENWLQGKGYQQIKISRNILFPQSPKTEDVNQCLSQLALLINSSIPLKQALAMILQNCRNIKLYLWLDELIQLIENGYTFSQSLEKLAQYISPQEIQLIKMGEHSGKFGTTLKNLAESRIKSEKLAKKIKKILFYPIIVLTISLSLAIGLLIFIVPQFAELYGSKEKTLPLITDILFSLSQFLNQQTEFLIGLPLAVIFFLFFAKTQKVFSKLKLQLLSKMPIFNSIIQQSRIIFFCQNTSLMLKAHLPLNMVLRSFLSEQNDDPILQKEIQFMLNLLEQGHRFSDSINPTIFGAEVVQMVEIGENSGNLATMCGYIGDIYQQKLDDKIEILSQLLEPILMLLMGIIVGTIIIGLYLPIFDMGAMV